MGGCRSYKRASPPPCCLSLRPIACGGATGIGEGVGDRWGCDRIWKVQDIWERGSGAGGRVIACDPVKAVKPDSRRNGESGEKARTWHGIGMGH